jgi:pilus assembly protein CpaE
MIKVLLASRTASTLQDLQECLKEQSGFDVHTRLISNGHGDPLHGLAFQPDIVVLRLDAEHLTELSDWAGTGTTVRPPLVVVGPPGDTEAMRLAIRSGAKDFLPEPVQAHELIEVLQRVRDEAKRQARPAGVGGMVHAIVGAAGGAGTSFVAANIARIIAGDTERTGAAAPILVDLDLNFAPLSHYLDLHPDRGLLQALDAADSMDEFALAGFSAKHRSGLRLLCSSGGSAVLSKDVSTARLARLIDVLAAHHQHVVFDLPHVLDGLAATVFSMSTTVVLVMQQSLLHVRNAVRLLQILKNELGVPPDRVRLVINRHAKEALVEIDDIRRTLGAGAPLLIPSEYRTALESADSGVLLYDGDRNSAVVRGLRQVAFALTGEDSMPRSGLLRRVLRISPGAE